MTQSMAFKWTEFNPTWSARVWSRDPCVWSRDRCKKFKMVVVGRDFHTHSIPGCSSGQVLLLMLLLLHLEPTPVSSSDDFHNSDVTIVDHCPHNILSGRTGSCYCTALRDIRCRDLDAVPAFVASGDFVYHGLYMSRQSITELPVGVFSNLNVVSLVLNFNPIGDAIETSPNAFGVLGAHLQELQLGGCQIHTLPTNFLSGLEELKFLHLWGNMITTILPGNFKEAIKLRELLLWGNQIEELYEDSFVGLFNLRRLDLDRNNITVLKKDTFRNLLELEVLHLGENSIKALHSETFTYLENLKVLNLDGNQIEFVYSRAFDGLAGLLSLVLNHNKISFIPDNLFSGLINLTALWLQDNQIDYVWAKTFLGLKSLQVLKLSNNKLSNLPDNAFRQSSTLRHLDLDHNKLQVVRRCAVNKKHRLRSLSLVGNPITCDCKLAWVLDIRRDHGGTIWGSCLIQFKNNRSSSHKNFYHLSNCSVQNYSDCQSDWVAEIISIQHQASIDFVILLFSIFKQKDIVDIPEFA